MLVRFIFLVSIGLQILLFNPSFSQLFTEDFSTPVNNTGIDAGANSGDYPGGVNWSLDASGATLTAGDYAMTVGGALEFQDTDGPVIWTSESVNIIGCTNVGFSIDINEVGDHESTDFVLLEYSTDGGSNYTSIIDWNGLGDASNTLVGDLPDDNDWQNETVTQGGLTGSSLVLRVTVRNNAGAEQIILDNMEVTGSCSSNTITTSNVSPLIFNVDCSTDDTGTVDFTSVGTFAVGNNFTAQLSDATGSFASPTNIGSIVLSGTDPSGTINVTIPFGTASGTGYRIRIISDNPTTFGSDNGVDITINLTGGPCVFEPPHMTSLIINSCNTTCGEGDNEVIFGNTGDYSVDMTTSNFEATYGTSPSPTTTYSNPIVSNAATTSGLNTVTSCPGLFIDAAGTTVPPNSTFMLVNDAFCPNDGLDLANFCGSGPIYVIYTTDGNWNSGGNFVNSSTCSGGVRYLTTTITATDGSTHTIDYEFDCTLNSGADGDYAKWNFNGGAAIEQGNNGCTLDPVVLPVELLFMTVEKNKTDALISWSTASERNNSHFILSHSIDGFNFQTISSSQGAGTTTQTNHYDDFHFSPEEGINYYKLQSVDFDGTTYLKGIRAIEFNFNNTYYDYSNNVIHTNSVGDFNVVNLAGQIVKTEEDTNQIEFSGTGIYIVQNLTTGEAEKLVIH